MNKLHKVKKKNKPTKTAPTCDFAFGPYSHRTKMCLFSISRIIFFYTEVNRINEVLNTTE